MHAQLQFRRILRDRFRSRKSAYGQKPVSLNYYLFNINIYVYTMRTHVVRILSLDTFYLKNRVLRQKKTCCSETSFTNIWSPNASENTETTEIISKDAVGRAILRL